MKRIELPSLAFTTFVLSFVVLIAAARVQAQNAKSSYPTTMAPVDQYLMDRDAEIALARSAAPESVSHDAEVLVLGRKGYETAIQGRNGFVCAVLRSWTDKQDDPEFWNPNRRGPICFNAAAAKSYLPIIVMRTNLVLAGTSKAQMFEALTAAFEKKQLPALESGAMCYMMSKDGHLSDRDGRWHPHLMFFVSPTEAAAWGANLHGSPIYADDDTADRMTVFMVPIGKWSDGTSDTFNGE